MAEKHITIERPHLGEPIPFWRDERVLRIAAQVISAMLILGLLWWAINNVVAAAQQRGLSLGFGFLEQSAGFPISEPAIPYDPSQSFARAFLVGVLNTLKVSILGIIFSTILGTVVALARLSTNWLVSKLALAFIEIHRNIPLLVLLFIWYSAVFLRLPRVRDSIQWPGPIYINQRGLYMVWPQLTPNGTIFMVALILGLILAAIAWIWLGRREKNTGKGFSKLWITLAIVALSAAAGWLLAGGVPVTLDEPVLQGFNFRGGLHLSPEFTALLIGLVTYTAAFIAEAIRAGIQAVTQGQIDAARALGLNYSQILKLVIYPQAMRVIIPPLISQYLNLTKNSSLAFFIGFPELFFIGKTTINQAGRALPVFLLVMAVYLAISLITSSILSLYNRRIQFVER
jgi:general L-amino acid transport system permease protein